MLRMSQILLSLECCSHSDQVPPPQTSQRSPGRCYSRSRWRRCWPDWSPRPDRHTQFWWADLERWGYWRAWQTCAFFCIDRMDRKGWQISEPSPYPRQDRGAESRCKYQSGDFADFESSNQMERSVRPDKNKAENRENTHYWAPVQSGHNSPHLAISSVAVLHYKLLACSQFYLWKGRYCHWCYGFPACIIRVLLYFRMGQTLSYCL